MQLHSHRLNSVPASPRCLCRPVMGWATRAATRRHPPSKGKSPYPPAAGPQLADMPWQGLLQSSSEGPVTQQSRCHKTRACLPGDGEESLQQLHSQPLTMDRLALSQGRWTVAVVGPCSGGGASRGALSVSRHCWVRVRSQLGSGDGFTTTGTFQGMLNCAF